MPDKKEDFTDYILPDELAFVNYMLSDEYIKLLSNAIAARICTSTSNKQKHIKALGLLAEFYDINKL